MARIFVLATAAILFPSLLELQLVVVIHPSFMSAAGNWSCDCAATAVNINRNTSIAFAVTPYVEQLVLVRQSRVMLL